MKTLTIRQPWASLIAAGVKTIETRSWSTRYRGPLAIHAAEATPSVDSPHGRFGVFCILGKRTDLVKHVEPCDCDLDNEETGERCMANSDWTHTVFADDLSEWPRVVTDLPLGAVVATCTLADVVPIVEREWCEDGFIGTRHDVAAVLPTDHPYAPGLHLWFGGHYDGDSSDQLPFGDFTPGRYAWLLTDITPLAEPIPAKGRQGLWEPTP